MLKNQIYSFLILSFALLSFGCDKVCKSTVQDFARVQNTTGRPLTLNLCKGRSLGEVQSSIPAEQDSQNIDIGTHEKTNVQGGMDAAKSCDSVSASSETETRISLAPASFGQVKLCYEQSSGLNLIVEMNQLCPEGYLEQTSTGSCSSF